MKINLCVSRVSMRVLLLGVMSVLTGCASSATPEAQASASPQELEEWRQMKPGLQRLVAMESELKQLIVQLDEFAKATNPDHASGITPQNKNTEVEVLDKQVFNETVVTPQPVNAEQLPSAELAEVSGLTDTSSPASEQAEQPVAIAEKSDIAKTEVVAVPVNTDQPEATVQSETVAVLPETNNVAPEVAETAAVQQRYALQLASVVNPDQLTSTWAQMQRRHSSILSGMEPLFEKYQKGNTTFYRLKAMGTLTVADARNACSSIVGQGGQCFIGSNVGVKSVKEL